ncbi:MAG: ABC transporter permease [Candidatus Eisenbacteria bacterium]|uniref:ABC transporter permease n=1 Tax=Eiseniibacteriota bacterium TaxID=2212470 RepID=A0A849SVF1_UNCEI|nr:ABC transporter permease [Candidatus Eisenbacteria bacterium]
MAVLARSAVPLLFAVLCLFGILAAHITPEYLAREMLVRFSRNSLLVLSLLIPILAGLGLNFGIVVGAMAGQIGAILVTHWKIGGIGGFALACAVATPIAIVFGIGTGWLFNRAKGREMVTGLIAGFFANGFYQLVFLFAIGALIPFSDPGMVLPQGFGLRNTVDLIGIQYAVDDLIKVQMHLGGSPIRVPVASFLFIGVFCLFNLFFLRTKLGQQLRAMGQDAHVAGIAGIAVERNRVIATVLSTIFAAWGQLFFLQNLGTLNTYSSHEQVGMFSIAALLVSGATVTRASVGQALIGTILFHTLFVVSPLAGKALLGDAQIGEYFRVFVAYAVITVALVLHAWQKRRG